MDSYQKHSAVFFADIATEVDLSGPALSNLDSRTPGTLEYLYWAKEASRATAEAPGFSPIPFLTQSFQL